MSIEGRSHVVEAPRRIPGREWMQAPEDVAVMLRLHSKGCAKSAMRCPAFARSHHRIHAKYAGNTPASARKSRVRDAASDPVVAKRESAPRSNLPTARSARFNT